jgi:hypothetical protein
MSKLWVFGLEFLVLGVLANIVAHYLVRWAESDDNALAIVSGAKSPDGAILRG